MIPSEEPLKHLEAFFKVIRNINRYSKEQFQGYYYRALLVNSNVRYLKKDFLKGRKDDVLKRILSLKEETSKMSKLELENNLNLTLYNIFKFHLDSFIGKNNTERTLEELELEMNRITRLIFKSNPPISISVEDTTSSIDESKEKGSKFRIRIVPLELLF